MTPARPPLPIQGYDHVELWVGNARQAAHYYRAAFGFRWIAYAGPETGVPDRASYVLQQGEIRLVLTSGLRPDGPIASHQARHGDSVTDVAFRVPDAAEAYELAVARGARPLREPEAQTDEHGKVALATIDTYGDVVHTLVQRDDYSGAHLPGYAAVPEDRVAAPTGLERIDHVVGNVELGQMEPWTAFYERVLGFSQFRHFSDEQISTGDTALMSNVLWDGIGRIKLPINEPARGQRTSQIDEYLAAHAGPGVQHLALETPDIVATVAALRERGVGFLDVPAEYYERARPQVGELRQSWDDLARLGILVDHDDEGYLLQVFTEPVQDRPTLFYELIQREGSSGFGLGNFKALFEAVERAQARRGNL